MSAKNSTKRPVSQNAEYPPPKRRVDTETHCSDISRKETRVDQVRSPTPSGASTPTSIVGTLQSPSDGYASIQSLAISSRPVTRYHVDQIANSGDEPLSQLLNVTAVLASAEMHLSVAKEQYAQAQEELRRIKGKNSFPTYTETKERAVKQKGDEVLQRQSDVDELRLKQRTLSMSVTDLIKCKNTASSDDIENKIVASLDVLVESKVAERLKLVAEQSAEQIKAVSAVEVRFATVEEANKKLVDASKGQENGLAQMQRNLDELDSKHAKDSLSFGQLRLDLETLQKQLGTPVEGTASLSERLEVLNRRTFDIAIDGKDMQDGINNLKKGIAEMRDQIKDASTSAQLSDALQPLQKQVGDRVEDINQLLTSFAEIWDLLNDNQDTNVEGLVTRVSKLEANRANIIPDQVDNSQLEASLVKSQTELADIRKLVDHLGEKVHDTGDLESSMTEEFSRVDEKLKELQNHVGNSRSAHADQPAESDKIAEPPRKRLESQDDMLKKLNAAVTQLQASSIRASVRPVPDMKRLENVETTLGALQQQLQTVQARPLGLDDVGSVKKEDFEALKQQSDVCMKHSDQYSKEIEVLKFVTQTHTKRLDDTTTEHLTKHLDNWFFYRGMQSVRESFAPLAHLQALKQTMQQTQNNMTAFSDRFSTIEKQLCEVQQNLGTSQSQKESTATQFSDLKVEVQAVKDEVLAFRDEIQAVKGPSANNAKELGEIRNAVNEIQSLVGSLEKKVDRFEDAQINHGSKLGEFRNALNKVESLVGRFEQSVDMFESTQSSFGSLSKQVDVLQASISQTRDKINRKVDSEIDSLKAERAHLIKKGDLDGMFDHLKWARDMTTSLSKAHNRLNELENLTKQSPNTSNKLDSIGKQLEALKQALQSSRGVSEEDLQSRLAELDTVLQSSLGNLQKRVSELSEDCKSIQEQLAHDQDDFEAFRKEQEEKDSELTQKLFPINSGQQQLDAGKLKKLTADMDHILNQAKGWEDLRTRIVQMETMVNETKEQINREGQQRSGLQDDASSLRQNTAQPLASRPTEQVNGNGLTTPKSPPPLPPPPAVSRAVGEGSGAENRIHDNSSSKTTASKPPKDPRKSLQTASTFLQSPRVSGNSSMQQMPLARNVKIESLPAPGVLAPKRDSPASGRSTPSQTSKKSKKRTANASVSIDLTASDDDQLSREQPDVVVPRKKRPKASAASARPSAGPGLGLRQSVGPNSNARQSGQFNRVPNGASPEL